MSILGKRLAVAALALTFGFAASQELAAQQTPEEIVERILELRGEIDDLLARLPPELREEVQRRLAEPAEAAQPTEPAEPEAPVRRIISRCNTLRIFDTNEDGRVDALDRLWRYLYLWVDRDGDGQRAEAEVESAYDLGVRAISISLKTFTKRKDAVGEIRTWGDAIRLDLEGDGVAEAERRSDDGLLAVDASRLARGDGPTLLGPGGETLEGIQLFRPGLSIRDADGVVTALDCP